MSTPKLTAEKLADLDECIMALDDEIQYLEEAIPRYEKTAKIRARFVVRYNKLISGRNFMAALIAEKRNQK